MSEVFRFAINAVADWSEARGVPVEYWRDDDMAWQATLLFHDANGVFTGCAPLLFPQRIAAPRAADDADAPGTPPTSRQERSEEFVTRFRKSLDAECVRARAQRTKRWGLKS